jgi:hypothetical protein
MYSNKGFHRSAFSKHMLSSYSSEIFLYSVHICRFLLRINRQIWALIFYRNLPCSVLSKICFCHWYYFCFFWVTISLFPHLLYLHEVLSLWPSEQNREQAAQTMVKRCSNQEGLDVLILFTFVSSLSASFCFPPPCWFKDGRTFLCCASQWKEPCSF